MQETSYILDIDEVSQYLNLSKSTIYKLAQEGRIPCQKVGRHWRFNRNFIDQWIATQGDVAMEFQYNPASLFTPQIANNSSVQPGQLSSEPKNELSTFFSENDCLLLKEYSVTDLTSLLVLIATKQGRESLMRLLDMTPSKLDKIAMDITEHYQNEKQE